MAKSTLRLIAIALSLVIFSSILTVIPVRAPPGGVVWQVPTSGTLAFVVTTLAGPNDEIHVLPGYVEMLVAPLTILQPNLWIVGSPPSLGPTPTIFLGGFSINIVAPGVFVTGLNILDSPPGTPFGIIISPSAASCIIWNNTITGLTPASTGIFVQSPSNIIASNQMSTWGTCIEINGIPATGNSIRANNISAPFIRGIVVSGGTTFNRVYWNNIVGMAPELVDGNPPGTVPNWFDDTTGGGGPSRNRGNWEQTSWSIPPPYSLGPPNFYVDNWPLIMAIGMLPGDLNLDGRVSLADLVLLANRYSSVWCTLGWDPRTDINGNGVVGLTDLVILANNYGRLL